MRPRLLLPIPCALVSTAAPAQRNPAAAPTPLTRGMVITASTRIAPRTYRLTASASRDSALIVVRGDNIVLDLTGVTVV